MRPDDGGADIDEASLRAKATPAGGGLDLVYTCAPPGSGQRIGIDRDLDGVLNGLDNCPAWPNGVDGGTCTAGDAELLGKRCAGAADCGAGGTCSLNQEDTDGDGFGDACAAKLLPEPGMAPVVALGPLVLCHLAQSDGRRNRPARRV